MKTVLSIDFDYFQTVSVNQIFRFYPDGVDLPTGLSTIVWADHFSNPENEESLRTIKAPQKKLQILRGVLRRQPLNTPVMMVNSHKYIYDFVCSNIRNKEPLHIINLDMHPDIANDNDTLDCGNWVSQLAKVYPRFKYTWVKNPISFRLFEEQTAIPHIETTDISIIRNIKYDAIFLCRSDNWLVPTLDSEFTDLYFTIAAKFYNIQVERGIEHPRDFMPQALEVRKQRQAFYEQQMAIQKQREKRLKS